MPAAIAVPAPRFIDCGKIMVVRPVPIPDQVGYARSIAARRAAKYPQISLIQRRIRIESLIKQGKHILVNMLFDVDLLLAFILCRSA